MRTYWLFILILISSGNLLAEIKNGYQNEIGTARESLKHLNSILQHEVNLTKFKEHQINEHLESALRIIAYYELTERLLAQFRMIAPEIYNEIDTIRDSKGRSVDVYVQFVPVDGTSVDAWGTTYLDQVVSDPDAYLSEYGERTVSVKIWTVNLAFIVLAHELGHVKYQVPNLATYIDFHKRNYQTSMSGEIGHRSGDLSGNSARQYEKRFRKHFASYLREIKGDWKSPVVHLRDIQRSCASRSISFL